MDRILIVHENDDLFGVLERVVRKELGASPIDRYKVCDAAAQTLLADPACRLAILSAPAPGRSDQTARDVVDVAIKDSLARLLPIRPDLHVLVLATESDRDLERLLEAHPHARLVLVSPTSGWRAVARSIVREAFGLESTEPATQRRTLIVLRIMLSNQSQGCWTVEHRGRVATSVGGTLQVNPVDFGDLRLKTEGLPAQFDKLKWADCLSPVSNDMFRMIFHHPSNAELRAAFLQAMDDPCGAEKIRIVFALPLDSYILPVETLKRLDLETNAKQWYGLHSAILRQYEGVGPLAPLFWDRESRHEKIDVLLIAADGRQKAMGLEPLPQVANEIDDVYRLLQTLKAAGANIGEIEVLKLAEPDDGKRPTVRLTKVLKERRWRVVHFAGHAIIDASNPDHAPVGRLVLQPSPDEMFDFTDFARLVEDAQLVFVSSCRSANQAFLSEVIRQSIPSVVGYRWPVKDIQARQLAVYFYRALFTPAHESYRSLGRALAYARREIFKDFASDVTWASPILLAKGERLMSEQISSTRAGIEAHVATHSS